MELPTRHRLWQNAPNPFNPTTTITFDIAHPSPVRLRIYDVAGRLVRVLVDRDLGRAQHDVGWDGRDDGGRPVASGVYFYRIIVGDFVETRKMVLLK